MFNRWKATCRQCGKRFLFSWSALNVVTHRTICSWPCMYEDLYQSTRQLFDADHDTLVHIGCECTANVALCGVTVINCEEVEQTEDMEKADICIVCTELAELNHCDRCKAFH